jgi:hypothetical protein
MCGKFQGTGSERTAQVVKLFAALGETVQDENEPLNSESNLSEQIEGFSSAGRALVYGLGITVTYVCTERKCAIA